MLGFTPAVGFGGHWDDVVAVVVALGVVIGVEACVGVDAAGGRLAIA